MPDMNLLPPWYCKDLLEEKSWPEKKKEEKLNQQINSRCANSRTEIKIIWEHEVLYLPPQKTNQTVIILSKNDLEELPNIEFKRMIITIIK